ncbi:hypothetical protein EDB92DRAFT_1821608 [Lactarius akahatsu]|uniref:Uncharacterized protein n=1 Tax=Lactarius akahatsu TaxID=416441 RepID=A0AAD4L3P2_9AGAM|nr:hypothetical protein EDB92DRAFT_1821608 [Lactarius akahatsu]
MIKLSLKPPLPWYFPEVKLKGQERRRWQESDGPGGEHGEEMEMGKGACQEGGTKGAEEGAERVGGVARGRRGLSGFKKEKEGRERETAGDGDGGRGQTRKLGGGGKRGDHPCGTMTRHKGKGDGAGEGDGEEKKVWAHRGSLGTVEVRARARQGKRERETRRANGVRDATTRKEGVVPRWRDGEEEGRQDDAENCVSRREGKGKGMRVGRGRQRKRDSGVGAGRWRERARGKEGSDYEGSERRNGGQGEGYVGKERDESNSCSHVRRCSPRRSKASLNASRSYTNVSPSPAVVGELAKIMAEVLSILGIATKGVKESRTKIFLKKVAGTSDLEDALLRFGELEQRELLTGVAQATCDASVLKNGV